jgi:hypothetical protein
MRCRTGTADEECERCTTNDEVFVMIANTLGLFLFSDFIRTSLEMNVRYSFQVRTLNEAGKRNIKPAIDQIDYIPITSTTYNIQPTTL